MVLDVSTDMRMLNWNNWALITTILRKPKMLNLEKARKEMEGKSYSQIQTDTAWTWASRASVSYEKVVSAEQDEKIVFWTVAEELYHEAVEHAALSGSDSLLKSVREAVQPYQEKAVKSISPGKELDII